MNNTTIKINGVEAIKARHESLAEEKSETIFEGDIDELLDELEEEVSGEPIKKVKKPSFIQNLVASFYRQKPSTMRCRFQKLAGIMKVEPAAKLTIGNNMVELSEIPAWYNMLRYTLCGFKLEIPNKCK
jgi:hypothetical protein